MPLTLKGNLYRKHLHTRIKIFSSCVNYAFYQYPLVWEEILTSRKFTNSSNSKSSCLSRKLFVVFYKSNFSNGDTGKCHITSYNSVCQRYREDRHNSVSINADSVKSSFERK